MLFAPGQQISAAAPIVRLKPVLESLVINDQQLDFGSAEWTFQLAGTERRYPINAGGTVAVSEELVSAVLAMNDIAGELAPFVEGVVRLAIPIETLAVPAGAIVQAGPVTCVITTEGDPRRVTIIASNIDGVQIAGAIEAGEEVQVEPERSTC